MATHREASRAALPKRVLIIGAVAAVAWILGEVVIRALGQKGYGWVFAMMAVIKMTEPLLDARQRISAWTKGSVGEEKTERLLEKLPPEFVVLHDLAIPGSKANIDHLVIGPTGVFVVDSKNYKWKITENKAGELWSGKYPMTRAIETLNWEGTKVAEALGGFEVGAILCVHGAELPRRNIVKNGVMLAGPRGTLRILQGGPTLLVGTEIQRLRGLVQDKMGLR